MGGRANNTLTSDIRMVAMMDAAMPTAARSITVSRPAMAVSMTAFAIIASCATSIGQARCISSRVEEAGCCITALRVGRCRGTNCIPAVPDETANKSKTVVR